MWFCQYFLPSKFLSVQYAKCTAFVFSATSLWLLILITDVASKNKHMGVRYICYLIAGNASKHVYHVAVLTYVRMYIIIHSVLML